MNETEASQSDALGPLASQTDHNKDVEEENLEFYRLSKKVAKTVHLSRVKWGWFDKEGEEEEEQRESAHYANLQPHPRKEAHPYCYSV